MTKTMSIKMDEENFEFLNRFSKEVKGDLIRAVRDLVHKVRGMLTGEKYRKREVFLGRASELAGVSVGEIVTMPAEFGVEANLARDDYPMALEALRKLW